MTYADMLHEARQPVVPRLAPGGSYADENRVFQGMAGVERAPGGRLWAMWVAGGQGESPLNYVMLVSSHDQGRTWSPPAVVIDPPGHVRAYDGNIWLDPQGRLWLFWTQSHTLHDGQWGVWAITTDQPDLASPVWSKPRRLMDGILLNKPTVRRHGEWLMPVSKLPGSMLNHEKKMLPVFLRRNINELMTLQEREAIDQRHGAYVYISTDHGHTFMHRGVARPAMELATHNEHMIVERNDGSLWMLLRLADSVQGRRGIGQSVSTDGGITWSPVTDSGIPHTPSRFFVRRLNSGNILLVKHGPMTLTDEYGRLNIFSRRNLTAYLSCDEGTSWQGGLLLSERGSYPDGIQSDDGTIHIIHDYGRREEKLIYLHRFNENDILAGQFLSSHAKQKIVVNQATGIIPPDEDWSLSKGQDESGEPLIFTGI